MAEDKKGFLLYADQKALFEQLPNDKAGELIKFLFAYVNDENPITDDLLINLAFTPIKQQLKRDLKRYEDRLGKKSISGREGNLKRWNLEVYNLYKTTEMSLEDAENMAKGRKASHTDKVQSHPIANIADNDNDNDNDNDISNKQSKIDFDALLNLINTQTKREFKVINKSIQAKYIARLKDGYTKDDIKNTIINSVKDEYHRETNFKYLTPEYYSRSATIDRFSQVEQTTEIKTTWSMAKHLKSLEK